MKREFYKDFYGCSASIRINDDGSASLAIVAPNGRKILHKTYNTYRGAKIAMGKMSECWTLRGIWN